MTRIIIGLCEGNYPIHADSYIFNDVVSHLDTSGLKEVKAVIYTL